MSRAVKVAETATFAPRTSNLHPTFNQMPTPVGHALGGFACGWLVADAPRWRPALAFAVLGALPDIDLLFDAHSTYTHSLGAALIVALLAWPFVRGRLALACGAAYASHVLLDWLGVDTSPPYGITALWPFSSAYFISGLDIFPAADRRYWLPTFWPHAITAITWEL